MSARRFFTAACCALIGLLIVVGCGPREAETPPPLGAAELPEALRTEFAAADDYVQKAVEGAITTFESKGFPQSIATMNGLLRRDDLTDEQRQLLGRAIITANLELQAAAESGDAQAVQFQRYQEANK